MPSFFNEKSYVTLVLIIGLWYDIKIESLKKEKDNQIEFIIYCFI